MPQTILPNLKAVFTNGVTPAQPVVFSWRMIRRKGRPFMLLPADGIDLQTGLGLYSAQRKRAKILRAALPFILKTPARIGLENFGLHADADAELMRFLEEQSGVPAAQIKTPAIKFGGVGQKSRIALLLCDETNRPVKVVKVGLNRVGRLAIDREAELLDQFPPDKLGCSRKTGRLANAAVSAFATDYFPGTSPADDGGMEHLFHSWLNPSPAQPIETLATWQELTQALATVSPPAWPALQAALAGRKIRTTLFHGDFAPWNIRAVNSKNLQVFDWERGHLQGIPGWDWFHFIIQTSILARRLCVERVAAEVEQLLHSRRFKDYAEAAGIGDIAKPLLLAYLVHQQHVVKPLEGAAQAKKLFKLLSAYWQMKPVLSADTVFLPRAVPVSPPTAWDIARRQLKFAATQWGNLLWEPTLNSQAQPSLRTQWKSEWQTILFNLLLLAAVVATQYFASAHLMFLPFYVAVCALATWRIDRRWGALIATVAAVAGPLAVGHKDAGYWQLEVLMWNTAMRFFILQMAVVFVDRIRRQKDVLERPANIVGQPVKLAENWVVILASGLFFAIVSFLDYITDPHLIFLPLYLMPCMTLTLVMNLRWGIAAAVVTAITGELVEYLTGSHYTMMQAFGWNFIMRVAVSVLVVVLLERIRKENIVFAARK